MTSEIVTEQSEGILTIKLNRPERKNALNIAMYTALADQLDTAKFTPEVKVVLLQGTEDCFTSGNDLGDFANGANLAQEGNPIEKFLLTLADFPKPVVVAVTGVAVGIGTTLLMHSDLVYASPQASFRLPFVNLGLCPEFASSLMLPRLAGHAKAAEWLMLGEFFSAQEALEGKLLNAIVEDPIAHAKAQCEKLVKQPPAALRNSKALMKSFGDEEVKQAIRDEIKVFGQALQGPEFAEAVSAFFEKRAADFTRFQ
ncbi:2,3-dehydroadipyl-CoA hydratase [Thalassocella blandensis]|nr:2,3-dehydroadipyl-CoA hydratase [Thalassocella blandensis]